MKLWTDENLNGLIVSYLQDKYSNFDLTRIQDTNLKGQDDPSLLEFAAQEGAIIITHDINTMTGFANQRLEQGLFMPGVIIIHERAILKQVLEDLDLVLEASRPDEFENRIYYIPLAPLKN